MAASRARGRGILPGAAIAWAVVLVLAPLANLSIARAQGRDSSAFHWELGAATDVTNEFFYEATFDDTTFTGRRLTGTPEHRSAMVAALELARLSSGRRLWLRQEATLGDKVMRSYTRAEWLVESSGGWRAVLVPELDLNRDESFGGDRRELRFSPHARLRHRSLDRSQSWDLLVGGDWFRAAGTSDLSALDRNAGRGWLRWALAPLDAWWDTELGYGADVRAFPDSVVRDHLEQHGALTLRGLLPHAGAIALDVQLDRRTSIYETPSTRDHFWSGRADGNAFLPLHERLTAEAWVSVDGYRYDDPDTSVYFDYQLWSALPALHWSLAGGWGLRLGPRFERLWAPEVQAERYTQVSAVFEFERLKAGNWLSFVPSAGWREYDLSAATLSLATPDLHSSYLFVSGDLFTDVGLPGLLRLRVSGSGRYESHEDPSQDASGIYLAVDLRRRF